MRFEWDENKNEENIRKHGIDFTDVYKIFNGAMIVNLDERVDYGEDRYIGVGLLKSTIAIVVFIEFDCDDIIRFISARRANKHEIKIFKQEIKNQLG